MNAHYWYQYIASLISQVSGKVESKTQETRLNHSLFGIGLVCGNEVWFLKQIGCEDKRIGAWEKDWDNKVY